MAKSRCGGWLNKTAGRNGSYSTWGRVGGGQQFGVSFCEGNYCICHIWVHDGEHFACGFEDYFQFYMENSLAFLNTLKNEM